MDGRISSKRSSQREPEGDFMPLLDRVKGNLVWWNKQLKELGVDQAALVGEPDHLVYDLSMIFTSFVERVKARFEKDIVSENERIKWIKNDKLPSRPELRDYFHAFESEENRSEMIGWVMTTFHLLHIIDTLTPQINQARIARLRPEGTATFRDVLLRPAELPVACQELLRHSQKGQCGNDPGTPEIHPGGAE